MNRNKTYTIYGINNSKAVMQSSKCIIKKIFLDYDGLAYKDSLIKQFISNKSTKYITNNKKFNSADFIMRNGLLVGCHPKLKNSDLSYIYQKIKSFLDNE